MKKLLAAAAVAAVAIAVVPAAPASADTVCAPVTADGHPIACADLTPIEQVIADAEAAVLSVEATVQGVEATVISDTAPVWALYDEAVGQPGTTADCLTGTVDPTSKRIMVDVVTGDAQGYLQCRGFEISVEPLVATPGPTQHVHVPQLCLTVTNTCAPAIDQDVVLPAYPASAVVVCQTPLTIYYDGRSWQREYTGPSTCTSVPLA